MEKSIILLGLVDYHFFNPSIDELGNEKDEVYHEIYNLKLHAYNCPYDNWTHGCGARQRFP